MCLIWTVFISHCRLHIIFCSHWFWTDKWIHPNSQTSPYCEYTWCIFFLKLGTLFHYSCYYINSSLWTKSSFKWLYTLPNYPISKEKSGDHFLFDETQLETGTRKCSKRLRNSSETSSKISRRLRLWSGHFRKSTPTKVKIHTPVIKKMLSDII